MDKIAIFVDWDNLKREIIGIQDNQKVNFRISANNVSKFIRKFCKNGERIYRIFFYTAKPLEDHEIKQAVANAKNELNWIYNVNRQLYDFKIKALNELIAKNNGYKKQNNDFLVDLEKESYIALRFGKLIVEPYSKNLLKQKQVDMLIGLDIAHIAYNKLVDNILLFSNDKDLAPALKCARVNGLNVFLANIKGNKYERAKDLVRHSDDIRTESLIGDPYINYTTN